METLTTALGVGIEVWDHDTLKDDFMGETLITLDRHNGSVQDGILENAGALFVTNVVAVYSCLCLRAALADLVFFIAFQKSRAGFR